MYGAETWTVNKKEMQCLQSFEMWLWKILLKISWKHNVTIEDVLNRVDEDMRSEG